MRAVDRFIATLGTVVLASLVAADSARAQEPQPVRVDAAVVTAAVKPSAWTSKPMRLGLVAGFAALQALDVVTSVRAINRGGSEGNPIVGGMASRPALFISVKTAATLWMLLSGEQLAKHGQAGTAVISSAIADTVYGVVVAHNAQVLRQLR